MKTNWKADHGRYRFSNIHIWIALACSIGSLSGHVHGTELGEVTIQTFDGKSIDGTLESIEKDGRILGRDLPDSLNLNEVVSIKTSRTVQRRDVYDVTLFTTDGGQLVVRNPEIMEERVVFRSGNGMTEVPLESLRAIVWQSSDQIERRIGQPSTDKDSVFVQTGDGERAVEGVVEALNREQLQINYQGQSRKIGVPKLTAVVMADLGIKSPAGSLATIRLADGSVIRGSIQGLVNQRLTVQVSGGSEIAVDSQYVVALSIDSDRMIFLSDIEPLDVQQKTEFAIERPWKRDRSVENNPLTIRYGKSDRVEQFNKGLGTQAFTQLVFENSNDFDRFQAIAGIAAETNGRGDCQMVVRGDGIELWSQRVRGSDQPVAIDVEIKGMRQIALIVYQGRDFDLADHANWGNARFVRTQ